MRVSDRPANEPGKPLSLEGRVITRRRFAVLSGGAVASLALGRMGAGQSSDGRIKVRPHTGPGPFAGGERRLGISLKRDGILVVPPTSSGPFPLLVLLHGAGGNATRILAHLGLAPAEAGFAVLAPDSRGSTWDAIRSRFGPDIAFLNRALERTFEMVAVDPARIVVGGFSDGATYALSLGLINGDVFRRVVAFSPGFIIGGPAHGMPPVFISHGKSDPVLPIDRCGRRIAAELRRRGYDVTLREFQGGHQVPADIARAGTLWAAGA